MFLPPSLAILYNLRDQSRPVTVLPCLWPALDTSLHKLQSDSSILDQMARVQESEEQKIAKEKQFQLEVEFTKNTIESQIASLELLTNLCTSEDWEDEMVDEGAPSFPPEIQEFCKQFSLPSLFAMCPPPQSPVMQALENSPAVFSEMIDFYEDRTCRSLTAIANIFNVVDPTQFSVTPAQIWKEIGTLVNSFTQESKYLKPLEACITAMRSFLCNCSFQVCRQ